jgi:quinol-cytochrome oxidoreductase complex cytochrome b subunit
MAVFKFHSPFLDDVKVKGFVPALLYKINESVERITAGLDIEDIRSVLRGDPPPRPNPRVKPHADGFWFHMRPTYYHNLVSGLYPTFRLGWFSVYFFVFETITGVLLMIFYTPSPLVAYENMLNLLSNVPFGRLMRDTHKLGAELMVMVVCLHMLRTAITGNYKKPRQFTWITGIILLGVTLFRSFSGYLLPWDQLSLWAVTIGASMAGAVPLAGDTIDLIMRGAPGAFNEGGLLRWYLLHVLLLPLVGFVMLGVHYYKVIIHGHSLPPEAEPVGEDSAKRVPTDQRSYFMPDVLTREVFYVAITTALMVVAGVFFYHAPLEPHADLLVTPLHTTAPWYFLWLQGMLKLGDKVIWGVIVPTNIIPGILLALPYVEVGPSRRYGDRRVGLTVIMLTVALLAVLSYMGTPKYAVSSSPDQEVVAELLPQTHPGILRTSNWEELTTAPVTADNPTGQAIYNAADWESAPTPTLRRLLRVYHEELEYQSDNPKCRAANNCLEDGQGFLIIENWQTDLKRLTFRVVWEDGPTDFCIPGALHEFCQVLYLHRLSNYAQGE